MTRLLTGRRLGAGLLCVVLWLTGDGRTAEAGGPFRRRDPQVYQTACEPAPARPASLGTFSPTPYVVVRGNWPTGGGYSPLDMYGNTALDIYGPTSTFRSTSAPILSYTRGYDGRPVVVEGTSFSNPLRPALSPVVYPTQATNYYGPRRAASPPSWGNGILWIDQN